MRVFKTRWFTRFMRKQGLSDEALREAVKRAERGLIDADLGGGIIKQRVARPGKGRSGGYRMIAFYRTGLRTVFIYGFAKSRKADLEPEELEEYRALAAIYLARNDREIEKLVTRGTLTELIGDGEGEKDRKVP